MGNDMERCRLWTAIVAGDPHINVVRVIFIFCVLLNMVQISGPERTKDADLHKDIPISVVFKGIRV